MITPKEYYIPKHAQVIFVSDLFVGDYSGGAELTSEVYITTSPVPIFKLHSASLTKKLVEDNKDKIWVFGNWTASPIDAIAQLVVSRCRYYVIEYDYKICKYRSPQLHFMTEHKECDCKLLKATAPAGLFVDHFYAGAQKVFFMSEEQANYYRDNTIAFNKVFDQRGMVLGSAWAEDDIQYLIKLRNERTTNGLSKPGVYAVLTGGSWIKNQNGTETFCKENGIPYELVGNLPYLDFLKALSQFEGLVFMPAGFDTAPRLVIEARIMGLNLRLNNMVQHQKESWFLADVSTQLNHIRSMPHVFWSTVFANR